LFSSPKKIGSIFYSGRRDDEMQRGEKKVEKQPKEKGFISSLWRSLILASPLPFFFFQRNIDVYREAVAAASV
jgi:hypothetical protein